MRPRFKFYAPKYNGVSKVLKELRWKNNMSTADVCRQTKISESTLFYIEDELDDRSPTLNTLYRLLDCYKINASEFFKMVEDKSRV